MEGYKANKEIVFYRIEKLDSSGNTIQNIYLPELNDITSHQYIDTQVKYGKEYTYKVYVWMLVYGLKYRYGQPSFSTNANSVAISNKSPEAVASVDYRQSIKLIEVPYFEHTTKILDKPPVHPNVEIIPYSGVNNKLMINLNSGAGESKREPVTIEQGESADIDNFYIAQNIFINQENSKLGYKTDDFAVKYRIYRLDDHPSDYSDFARGVIRDIDTPNSVSVSLEEKVIPNKIYWYTFRAIDAHDHLSYPSPVYQVQIVDDGSSIYPLVTTVELKGKGGDVSTPVKKLKRLMQIIPSTNHLYFTNDVESKIVTNKSYKNLTAAEYKLGAASTPSIWGKKFKIRLTSKKTGKKIDINVGFKNEHKS